MSPTQTTVLVSGLNESTRRMVRSRFRDSFREATAVIIVVVILGLLSLLWYFRAVRDDQASYEGQIVDKSITTRESDEGSRIQRSLSVKLDSGAEFQIVVGSDLFERANVGDRMVKDENGIRLLVTGNP
jgi:hypothetical protein